jgi:plastocyanin
MKMSMIIGIVVVVVIVIIAGVYLATQNKPKDNTPVGDNPVIISGFAFSPNIITVHVGDTVTWKNNDGVTHTVTSDSNSTVAFNSGNMNDGATFTFTFTTAGDYWYHCTIHPSMAHAIVRVIPVTTG